MPRKSIEERFWAKVQKTDDCWLWQASTVPLGYGQFYRDGRPIGAHRVSYELANGPVSHGFELDHLCRNPPCVRPDHLEAVTHRENLLRGNSPAARESRVTSCPKGHVYDEANTVLYRGKRQCRTCARDRARERYHIAVPNARRYRSYISKWQPRPSG